MRITAFRCFRRNGENVRSLVRTLCASEISIATTKIPKCKGGTDKYSNLVLILEPIHKLIHTTNKDIIAKYLEALRLKKSQLDKVNAYRQLAGLESIA